MFEEKLRSFIARIDGLKEKIQTEEATKTSLIMPFFAMLGYDVFNPAEFIPEFVADVGIKKGEKVDYAIIIDNEPTILIEAKAVNEKLEKHDSQLFRYFGTTKARFAILTNGIEYRFFTDLDKANIMDSTPFLTVNLEQLKDSDMTEIKKFCKERFDKDSILNSASDLKYCGLIKDFCKKEFASPSDAFTKFILSSDIHSGKVYQNTIDKFKPLVKKALTQYISELVNDKIKIALNSSDDVTEESDTADTSENETLDTSTESSIITTAEELQSFYIIKSLLGSDVDLNRITYKDTISYFSVLLDKKVTRWICRLYLKENIKYIIIPNGDTQEKIVLNDISDIYNLATQLKTRLNELH